MYLKKNGLSFDTYTLLILISIELIMSFTFFGYISIPPISVTFAYIPILVAAYVLGTVQSTILGAVFGLASMYKSYAYYNQPADKLFSPFLSGNYIGSIMISVGARVIFGLFIGLIFAQCKKQKRCNMWIYTVSAFSSVLQAIPVMIFTAIFFPDAMHNYVSSPYLILSNALLALICVAVSAILIHCNDKLEKLKSAINRSKYIPHFEQEKKNLIIAAFTVFIFIAILAATVHFTDRTNYMLKMHNITSDYIKHDIIHLQTQFTIAVISLSVISITVLNLIYQYTAYKNFLGEHDNVTGLMGRRLFLNCCEKIQKSHVSSEYTHGWFIFIDIDYFKEINDTFGHVVGDSILKEFAVILKSVFYNYGLVCRMGGDEFAVMTDSCDISETELGSMLDKLSSRVAAILEKHKVSCSIGACRYTPPVDIISLMDKTDSLLYKAKENGRSCYVIGTYSQP